MGRYSRLERHNKKQSNRQAFYYIILSILFIGGMIKWGLPTMIGLVTGFNTNISSTEESNGIRPQRPSLVPLPEATFSATIKIEGLAQPDTQIKLRMNGLDSDEVTSDSDGGFKFNSVELLQGENQFEVFATRDDLESDHSKAVVIQDDEDPKLTITSPAEEHKFFGIDQKNLEIVGEVSEDAEITINDNFVHIGEGNKFVFRTSMNEGANDYTIKVADRAGNTTERLFRVFYTK